MHSPMLWSDRLGHVSIPGADTMALVISINHATTESITEGSFDSDIEGLDLEASASTLDEQVEAALRAAFPDAEIRWAHGQYYTVDVYSDDPEDEYWARQYAQDVWDRQAFWVNA